MLILLKFSKDLDFGQTFTKNSIGVKFFENIDFGWNCRKKFKFGQNFEKSRFWWKLSKIVDFGQFTKMMKILLLVIIFGKCRFGWKLTKLSILDKTEKNSYFNESFKKDLFW